MSRALIAMLVVCAALLSANVATARDSARAPKARSLHAIEQAFEVSGAAVVLPAAAPGSLVVTPCDRCAPRSLDVSPTSQFFIGGNAVTLVDFRAAVVRQPRAGLTVLFRKDGAVTRVLGPASLAVATAGDRR